MRRGPGMGMQLSPNSIITPVGSSSWNQQLVRCYFGHGVHGFLGCKISTHFVIKVTKRGGRIGHWCKTATSGLSYDRIRFFYLQIGTANKAYQYKYGAEKGFHIFLYVHNAMIKKLR